MTRVSDTPAFADAVAAAGPCPFLALALLRKAGDRDLAPRDQATTSARSRGASASSASCRTRSAASNSTPSAPTSPPFAIIAGGRPDQAKELEAQGSRRTCTSRHRACCGCSSRTGRGGSSSRGRSAAGTSARGRASRCGRRWSRCSWSTSIGRQAGRRPARRLRRRHPRRPVRARWSRRLAAPLAEKGVKVGVLLGTAYLFTKEAVAGGRDHARGSSRKPGVRRHGAAGDRPRPRDPLHPDALRRDFEAREAQDCRPRASRRWKSASRWNG